DQQVNIPLGANNLLSGTYVGQDPVEDFLTGDNTPAFGLTTIYSDLASWSLTGPDGSTSTATPNEEDPVCESDPHPDPLPVVLLDPYCTAVGATTMQWVVDNPNAVDFTVDGGPVQGGFIAAPGSSLLFTTPIGTQLVDLYWGLAGHTSLEWTITSCGTVPPVPPPPGPPEPPAVGGVVAALVAPVRVVAPLPVPVTGGAGGELLIPVTGADLRTGPNGFMNSGLALLGLGMVMTGLRRRYNL
ncbi:MAG: hypothetical protein FD147_2232, partial [Chloroflexi bacterium]